MKRFPVWGTWIHENGKSAIQEAYGFESHHQLLVRESTDGYKSRMRQMGDSQHLRDREE